MTEQTTDLTELFSRDPLKLTLDDIDAIIEEMRKKRVMFQNMPTTKSGSPAAPKLTEKQQQVAGLKLDIKL